MKKDFFSQEQTQQILDTIQAAERKTSGEIRIHLENRCWGNPLKRAAFVFKKLQMHKTKQRNGVLIYIAIQSQKYAIVGDQGIHQKIDENFWNSTINKVQQFFRKGKMLDGICHAIDEIALKLERYFPIEENDKNELSNEISTGDLT